MLLLNPCGKVMPPRGKFWYWQKALQRTAIPQSLGRIKCYGWCRWLENSSAVFHNHFVQMQIFVLLSIFWINFTACMGVEGKCLWSNLTICTVKNKQQKIGRFYFFYCHKMFVFISALEILMNSNLENILSDWGLYKQSF